MRHQYIDRDRQQRLARPSVRRERQPSTASALLRSEGTAGSEPSVDPEVARLARRFAAGDEAAIRELHARYGARVLAAARRVVGDRRLAEDVAQETWLRAWRRAHTLDPRLPIEPWLFRIARNTAIDALRHAGRRPAGAPLDEPELLRSSDDLTDPASVGERLATRWAVRAAIEHLPDGERDVVRLHHLHGLTHAEVADRLGISVGTVKSRSYRAHRRLAAVLRDHRLDRQDGATVARNSSTTERNRSQAGSSACRM